MSLITDWVDKKPEELQLETEEHKIRWCPQSDGSMNVVFEERTSGDKVMTAFFKLDHDEAVKAARWLSENWLETKQKEV